MELNNNNRSQTDIVDGESDDQTLTGSRILAIEGGAGLGKSTQSIDMAIEEHSNIEIYVPTHALAEEARDRIIKVHQDVVVTCIRGRTRQCDNNGPMCARHEVVSELHDHLCFSVYGLLCESGGDSKKGQCEFYSKCEYIAQFEDPAEKIGRKPKTYVRFYPHSYLGYPRSKLDGNEPDFAIIDESFLSDMEIGSDYSQTTNGYGQWRWKIDKLVAEDGLFRLIATTLIDGKQLLPTLYEKYPDLRDDLKQLAEEYETPVPGITPDMNDSDCRSAISILESDFNIGSNFAPLLEVLIEAVESGTENTQAIWYDQRTNAVNTNMVRGLDRLDGVPILIIDGTMNIDAIRKVVHNADYRKISPVRKYQGHTIQIYDTPMSRNKLVPGSGTNDDRGATPANKSGNNRAVQYQQAIEQKLRSMSETMGGGLIVSYKPFIKKLSVPDDCSSTHFGNLRGKNAWEHINWVVVIGRNQPRFEACENRARAYYGNDEPPLELNGGELERREVGYRIRGGWRVGVPVDYHPDERVQGFVYSVREAEVEQSIDRIRLIQNENKTFKQVFIISNVPVNVTIDTLMTFDQWTGADNSTILHRAWDSGFEAGAGADAGTGGAVIEDNAEAGGAAMVKGLLPLSARWLLDNVDEFRSRFGAEIRNKHPGISDEEVDQKCVKRINRLIEKIGNNPPIPFSYNIWGLGINNYYKIQGAKGKRKRCISLWGRQETLRVLSLVYGSGADLIRGGARRTELGTPKIVLTDSISPISKRVMYTAYTAGLIRGGWTRTADCVPGLVPGRYPLFDALTDSRSEVIRRNIKCSDGTIILSNKPDGDYAQHRVRMCEEIGRPYLVVPYSATEKNVSMIKQWLQSENIEVLFVPGSDTREPKKLSAGQKLFRLVFGPRISNNKKAK
jgi:hypothetical protein